MKTARCNGKIQFSKNGAEKFSKSKKISRITKKKLRVYFCPRCTNYHLTTDRENPYNR